MAKILGTLHKVLTGKAQPFTRQSLSAINKQPRTGKIAIHQLGLEGDEQGDTKIHGGIDKAIHHYAAEHYLKWQQKLGKLPLLQQVGAFGENFSSYGMTEQTICFGDIIQIGTTIVEVSQCRQPCWKLNDRFNQNNMAKLLQETTMVGWYYRVLQTGEVTAGDSFYLLDRPFADWSLKKVATIMFSQHINREELQAFSLLPLTPSWQKTIDQRLITNKVEDWSARLDGKKSS